VNIANGEEKNGLTLARRPVAAFVIFCSSEDFPDESSFAAAGVSGGPVVDRKICW